MGSPLYPNASQLAALHAASEVPVEVVSLQSLAGGGGDHCALRAGDGSAACEAALSITLRLPAYGVAHLSAFA